MRVTAVLMFAFASVPLAAHAESMRCGKWVVSEAASTSEIVEKCGEPQKKDVQKEDVVTRNPGGYVTKRGEQVTERWYYKPTAGSLTMVVKILDGKVISIERAD